MSSEALIIVAIVVVFACADLIEWRWIRRQITDLRHAQASSDRSRETWVENIRNRISDDECKIAALKLDAAKERARLGELAKRLGFEYNEIETRGWKRIGGPEQGE